jgi:hypothetical protein
VMREHSPYFDKQHDPVQSLGYVPDIVATVGITLTDVTSYRLKVITPFQECEPQVVLCEAILSCN